MKKVVLLSEIISPYRIPVFNQIAQILKNKFMVLFFAETEKRRKWRIYKEKMKFNYEILPNILFQRKDHGPNFFNPTIFFRLAKYSPEILIIGGYHHFSSILAMLYAKLFKRRIILWCESTKYDLHFSHPLKEAYKRWFVKNCDGCIVAGKASFEYITFLGAEAKKVWLAPNAVDSAHFIQLSEKYRQNRDSFKKSKGYPKRLILYVGRLIDQKGIFDLLRVFQILSLKQSDLGLLLIGNGKGEERYKDFCLVHNLRNVFFEGFIDQEELPLYYAVADVFVLPTYSDPWGLVLNEAMSCKLPVISSDAAGAAGDLISDGENGYIFKKGDIDQLTRCLTDILMDDNKKATMGQRSLETIKHYSPLKCAEGIIQAIEERR